MIEEWRPISGFEGSYAVSNLGRIKSLSRIIILVANGRPRKLRERIMSGRAGAGGVHISLRKPGEKQVKRFAHRLIAAAFMPAAGQEIRHRDGNNLNNVVGNLEWLPHPQIMVQAWARGAFAHKVEQQGAARRGDAPSS
jgi:hypothetical protein